MAQDHDAANQCAARAVRSIGIETENGQEGQEVEGGEAVVSWETSWDDEGWWSKTVTYGEQVFSARCPDCARFVKTDETADVMVEQGGLRRPNATCKKHGRVMTPFLAWTADATG